MDKILSVTIIGLGDIGMLYDYDIDQKWIRLTHLKSFNLNKKFEVINCIDISDEKLDLVKKKYGNKINCYNNFTSQIKKTDIYVLSSQPEINLKYFYEISKKYDCFFVIEKPCWEIKPEEKINLLSKNVYFNYFRKTIPAFKKLKNELFAGSHGKIQSINCYYTKGLNNNGSHLIDLIFYFFGSNIVLNSINVSNSINDYNLNDKTISFSFKIKYKNSFMLVNFIGLDENLFSIIEMDIMAELNRISIKDFGNKIIYEKVGEDQLFKGYKKHINTRRYNSKISMYGDFLANHIHDIFFEKTKNDSNFSHQKIISKFIRLINEYETKGISNIRWGESD